MLDIDIECMATNVASAKWLTCQRNGRWIGATNVPWTKTSYQASNNGGHVANNHHCPIYFQVQTRILTRLWVMTSKEVAVQ